MSGVGTGPTSTGGSAFLGERRDEAIVSVDWDFGALNLVRTFLAIGEISLIESLSKLAIGLQLLVTGEVSLIEGLPKRSRDGRLLAASGEGSLTERLQNFAVKVDSSRVMAGMLWMTEAEASIESLSKHSTKPDSEVAVGMMFFRGATSKVWREEGAIGASYGRF